MSGIRILALLCIVFGGAITAVTTVRFYSFLRYTREERYAQVQLSRLVEVASLCTMIFFLIGFGVGGVDILVNDVQPIFLFVTIVFFVGAVFIAAMVQVQISMARSLRDKTMEVMRGFVNSIELKDPYTQGHSWHVYHLVATLYRHLPAKTRQAINEPKLLDAALLHDIGKMGVDNHILNKKGPLTDAEWEAMKTHPKYGVQTLESTCFSEIGDWVLYHHERVDGGGYYGLAGDAIPLEARIIALADTYSAITTDREYRPKRSHAQATDILRDAAGAQLDAELVGIFCSIPEGEVTGLFELALQRQYSGSAW